MVKPIQGERISRGTDGKLHNDQIEDAARRMYELAASDLAQQLRRANEATTRLRIIDEVLDMLGWPKVDDHPERATSTRGYTDYLLSINSHLA